MRYENEMEGYPFNTENRYRILHRCCTVRYYTGSIADPQDMDTGNQPLHSADGCKSPLSDLYAMEHKPQERLC